MNHRPERRDDAPAGRSAPAPTDAGELTDLEGTDALGAVRIAPQVLRTVVAEAALHVSGVARMASGGGSFPRLLGRSVPRYGVGLAVQGESVKVDVYLVAEPTANMLDVGAAVQEAVSAAVEHILGMHAQQINVYIEDVA